MKTKHQYRIALAGVVLAFFVLGGCASIDPDGEWRGTPEARLRSCQALMGSTVAAQINAVATTARRDQGGGLCPASDAASAMGTVSLSAPRQQGTAKVAPYTTTVVDPIQLAATAERAYADGRHSEAASLFEQVVEAQPGNASAWLRRANSLHRLNQLDGANRAYQRALELTSTSIPAGQTPDTRLIEIRSKASANLAILGIEQARRALDALGSAEGDPIAAEHRSRIEAALRAVVNAPGPDLRSAESVNRIGTTQSALLSSGTEGLGRVNSSPTPTVASAIGHSATVVSAEALPARPAVEVIRGLTAR